MLKLPIYVSSLTLLLASCGSEPDALAIDDKTYIEIEAEKIRKPSSTNEIFYSIPSPNEQYGFLYDLNDSLISSAIHSLSGAKRYTEADKIALNIGVYISDLAYLMRYDLNKKHYLDYVSTLEHLENELNISNVYGEELIKEIQDLGTDKELFLTLSSQNYTSLYNQFIENEKEIELALILTGSWIETMHVLFTASIDFNKNLEIQNYIIDQRLVLDNLMSVVQSYGADKRLDPVIENLKKLNKVYKKLVCKDASLEIENDGEAILLNGGLTCVFTSSTYFEVKSLIQEIRTSIIS